MHASLNIASVFIVSLFISSISHAGFSCHLTEQLGNSKISSNANFWKEFGKISGTGTDRELAQLFKRYDVDARAPQASSSSSRVATERRTPVPTGPAYQMNKVAAKELGRLQPNVRSKANEFLEMAKEGSSTLMARLRKNQGGWQLEKLEGDFVSVRLNQGYRVKFRERADSSIEIVNFSKTATHGGH